MDKTLLLGIDPSFKTMGVCILDPVTKEMKLKTGEFNDCVTWIGQNCKLSQVLAIVENPDKDSPAFKMWGVMKKEIEKLEKHSIWRVTRKGSPPPYISIGEIQSSFSICMNYAQKVGKNKAAAQLIIKMLAEKNVPIIEIPPSKRQKAYKDVYSKTLKKKVKVYEKRVELLRKPTKTNAEQFKKLTGYSKRCSEHARDAATLVWGYGLSWLQTQAKIIERRNKLQPSFPNGANGNQLVLESKSSKRKNVF